MNIKTQKIAAVVLIGVVIVIGGYSWWNQYGPYDITTPESEIGSLNEYNRFLSSLEKAWENDHVGFATPEETFDAFREALKAGDYELAASYFVPEKQQEMLERFADAPKEGLDKQIELLYLNGVWRFSDNKEKISYLVSDLEGHNLIYVLRLNPINNIWKMYEL